MLVEYYHPSFLPCFDDTKSNQTTTEVSAGSCTTLIFPEIVLWVWLTLTIW